MHTNEGEAGRKNDFGFDNMWGNQQLTSIEINLKFYSLFLSHEHFYLFIEI